MNRRRFLGFLAALPVVPIAAKAVPSVEDYNWVRPVLEASRGTGAVALFHHGIISRDTVMEAFGIDEPTP